jgi:V-type H+-transporting ATPase subunit a
MGSLFRSETMTLAQLFLQSESAYACVRELGELGRVQFRDLNPAVSAFQRKFINEVRRCDEMERRLRYLEEEVKKVNIQLTPGGNVQAPDPQDMIDLESKFEVLEAEVKEINANKETLKRNLLDLIELQHILQGTQIFFQEAETYMIAGEHADTAARPDVEKGLLEPDTDSEAMPPVAGLSQTRLTFVAGVIARERMPVFERVLWRACRGNVFLRQAEIMQPLEDPTTGQLVYKVVFILFFQGDQLRTRVKKICEGFHATLYQCPETVNERAEMSVAVSNRINDLTTVLRTTEDHSITQLQEVSLELDTWKTKVKKIKSIYHALNMFNLDVTQRCLIAECWCPVEDLDQIQQALTTGTERSGSTVPSILNRMSTNDAPPTYFKTNKFTRGYQAIVDSYGVANYGEVNPTLFTIITFPFLFGVMFGDAGHGTVMFLFALTLIVFEKRLQNYSGGGEMFTTIFQGRYIIVLMGAFSIYTGLIYNDVFSKSLNIFGSHWNPAYPYGQGSVGNLPTTSDGCQETACLVGDNTCVLMGEGEDMTTIFPREATPPRYPYPFGIDPVWQSATNKLVFTNTYKMKMSIILGVGQMFFGVILSVFNHVHFANYHRIVMEFIPQILFLLSIFGWLIFLIIYKFCSFYKPLITAPSLLITLIQMFLEFNKDPKDYVTRKPDDDPDLLNEYSVFGSSPTDAVIQAYIMKLLVVVAVVCVPWMLVCKPVYLRFLHKKRTKKGEGYKPFNVQSGDSSDGETDAMVGAEPDDDGKEGGVIHAEEFEFGEVFIHQSIHTIEYCLGTISNTASYLRLWALSLAHAELSEVLWQMVLQMYGFRLAIQTPLIGWLIIAALWVFWAVLTVGILLVMEGLSAFLHALRLHWYYIIM